MFGIIYIIFVLTLIAFILLLKDKVEKKYHLAFNDFVDLEDNFKDLVLKEKQIKEENFKKEENLIRIMNLYEFTKEICEFLDEDKIFSNFKKGLRKFIHFDECNYLDSIESQKDSDNLEIIPLISEAENYGYLAIKGFNYNEKSSLDILIAQFITSIKRSRLYKRVQELSITDSLTKIFTRRYCLDRFEEELRRSEELSLLLSFLMIDIDNFKSFNDKYGHLVGDVILKTIAEIIKVSCREIDLIGRFGGEEFMVILPMTSKDGALFVAERIRKAIESRQIKAFDELLNLTVSIGVASFPQDDRTTQEIMDKADSALYHSKRNGKNKVSAYTL